MPGDYSRSTFDPTKQYSGVRMQQGRVQLDADWNEQADIQHYRDEIETKDVIGQCGVPKPTEENGFKDGFKIGVAPGMQDLTIGSGRIYVEGMSCELETDTTYTMQPYYPNPDFTVPVTSPPTSPPAGPLQLSLPDGTYLAFLDAWKREITALNDPHIREQALGGPDTTTRLQNVWQVKLLKVSDGLTSPPTTPSGDGISCDATFEEYTKYTAQSSGTMNAWTAPPEDQKSPCRLPPGAGYRRFENQLYRVEVHRGGTRSQATFKWSRDNATVETTIEKIEDAVITVSDVGKDVFLGFANEQWVEIVDEESTLKGTPNTLVKIDQVHHATRQITLESSIASLKDRSGLKLRRWDQTGETALADGISMTSGWFDLEGGIQVQFSGGTYRSGDYWLIPARTATAEIEWPPFDIPNTNPVPQPPVGIRHYYCQLALLHVNNGNISIREDCRKLFKPLTDVGVQVRKVFATGAYYRDILLIDGMSLSTDILASGLRIVLNQSIAPVSVSQAACYVVSEIPFPINESDMKLWGDAVIGYQPLILAAEVSVNNQREITWKPSENTKSLLMRGFPESIWKGKRVVFDKEWDIYDMEGLGLSWNYRAGSVVVSAATHLGDNANLGLGSVALGKHRIKENIGDDEGYIEMHAEISRGSGNVGIIFNWESENDYWMFLCRGYWVPVGFSGAYKKFDATVVHVVSGEVRVVYDSTVAVSESPRVVWLGIRQGVDRLHFWAAVRTEEDLRIPHVKRIEFDLRDPQSLIKNSGLGLISRFRSEVTFTRFEIIYHQDREELIPPSGKAPVLTRLTVKRNFLQPKAWRQEDNTMHQSNSVKPCADFDMWFWLVPAYPAYPYGYGHRGIGGDLI